MRTTLTIDNRVYEHAKSVAVLSGKGLGEVISELALAGINARETHTVAASNPLTLDQDRPAKVNPASLQLALQNLP
jgi:hypothetical protein